jgi:hypothetical protein
MKRIRRFWDRYLAMLTAGTFKTDPTGATVFFPSGILRRGYVVDADREAAIRHFLTRFYLAVFALAVVGARIFGVANLLILPPILVFYWLWSRRTVAGLPVSSLRVTRAEAERSTVRIFGRRWLAVLLIFSMAMTAASLGMLLSPTYQIAGLLGLGLFGFASYRLLSTLIRYRPVDPDPVEPLP